MKYSEMSPEEVSKRRERMRKYQSEHKDEINSYQIQYVKTHKHILKGNNDRAKSKRILKELGIEEIEGYEIHHFEGHQVYDSFVYIPAEIHTLLHSKFGKHNISVGLGRVFMARDIMPVWFIVKEGKLVFDSRQASFDSSSSKDL